MGYYGGENQEGHGFFKGIFRLGCKWLRKPSVYLLPAKNHINKSLKVSRTGSPRRRRSDAGEVKPEQRTDRKLALCYPTQADQQKQHRRHLEAARSSTSSSSNGSNVTKSTQLRAMANERKQGKKSSSNSAEQRHGDEKKALIKPTSGNVKLFGNGKQGSIENMGNIVRKNCGRRGLDHKELKFLGNEAYSQGRFEDALVLYDRAMALDPHNAVYHSNKSAALIGLDRLIEAVDESEKAIQIEPFYFKAHRRLATLYVRIGETEKALHHLRQSGPFADSREFEKAQALESCLNRCIEAQKQHHWESLLKETQNAISSGANSAPKVNVLQAEALLRLQRHEDAYATYQQGQKLFRMTANTYFLMIETEIYMTMGRFEDAVAAAQEAAKLDPSNKDVTALLRRAKMVSSARMSGNLLFKASKFSEACVVYSEGLDHDPNNSVLLCNRAACRSKLGQFEKAIEDCTAALRVRPSYSKARLRRADCNGKLERWEASVQDYEILIGEIPGNEEVAGALFEAQVQLKKQRGEDVQDEKFGSNLLFISSNEGFRHLVTSPGLSVVLFCNKKNQKPVLQLLEQVCSRFPSVNFLKVEIEDHPFLTKSEGVGSVPSFKIYRNGTRVKEIPGNNGEMLENSVRLYSSQI